MKLLDFFGLIHPDAGHVCIVGIKNKVVKPSFHSDLIGALKAAGDMADQNVDVYFGVASFADPSKGRTQANALQAKALWLDLDCGPNKDFDDQHSAQLALGEFLDTTKLPVPITVSSGNGIHVYWPLSESVPVSEWQVAADLLKAACVKFNFPADPVATSDSARILRVPGTFNFKAPDDPKDVEVIDDGAHDANPVSHYIDALRAAGVVATQARKSEAVNLKPSATTLALMGHKQSKFSKIARVSLRGAGCNFLKESLSNQAGMDEPKWRATLSIAQACVDSETAIHKVSDKHPEYSAASTIEKANQTGGPYKCSTIRDIAPSLCEGCTLRISSPISLGEELIPAAKPEPVEEAPQEKDVPQDVSQEEPEKETPVDNIDGKPLFADLPAEVSAGRDKTPAEDTATITPTSTASYSPPSPYFALKGGGIGLRVQEGGESFDTQIYENDFYPTMRLSDRNYGEAIVFRLHLPQDGIREFTIPLRDIITPDKFKSAVASQGVAASNKQLQELQMYSIKYVKELQRKYKSTEARMQFGWHDNNETIVLGTRAYTKSGKTEYNPASSTTAALINAFEPKGSLDVWKRAVNAFAPKGLEPHQLTVLLGFGAPLLKFTGVKGCTVNLMSDESGTGKTSAQIAALSIFGNPDDQMLIKSDTLNMRIHRMGVMGNFLVAMDEMTNVPPEELSELLYMTTQGRGKGRMRNDVNLERENTTVWQLPVVASSNSSMAAKLASIKARPDGELMRLVEHEIDKIVIPDAESLFEQLSHNYGVAGEVFLPFLVQNKDECVQIILKERDELRKAVGLESAERFMINIYAVTLGVGIITQGLGLVDYDLNHLRKWVIAKMNSSREQVQDSITASEDTIALFLSENVNSILGVGGKVNPMTGNNIIHPVRNNKVVARFEADQHLLYISTSALRAYCVDRQLSVNKLLAASKNEGSEFTFMTKQTKRLLAGSGMDMAAVKTYVFKCSEEIAETLVISLSTDDQLEP